MSAAWRSGRRPVCHFSRVGAAHAEPSAARARISGSVWRASQMTGHTQSAFLALGSAGLYFLILFVFALCERKNEKIIIEKYHAAAGYKPLSNGHRVCP